MKKIYIFLVLFCLSIAIHAQYNMRANNGQTITTCKASIESSTWTSDPLACSGGFGYCNSENYQVTFFSGTAGSPLAVNFIKYSLGPPINSVNSFRSESGSDYLYIYDNATGTGAPIATLTGLYTTFLNYTSTTGYLTFKWVSNGATREYGFQAIIGCQPSSCNGNLPAGDDCSTATQICSLNGYCGNTSGWYTADHTTLAGGALSCVGSIENNSWISFIANSTSASFNIVSGNCLNNNSGIQAGILSATSCTGTFTLKSNCVAQSTAPGAFTLNATGLTVGSTYYLMVDGFAGNICDYTVQALSGVQTVSVTSSAGSTLCPGQSFTLSANASGAGPFTYSWSPAPVSGQGTISATYTAASSGTYSVTITGACGATQTATYYQTVSAPPTVSVSGTSPICAGGAGTTLTASGTNTTSTLSFTNSTNYIIPDNSNTGVTSNITVSGIPGTVGSQLLSVCLNITHGYDNDLDIYLKCPSGTTILLSGANGGSGDNYTNTCFTVSGSSISSGAAPFSGSYTPEQAFSLLSGCTANGTWSLIVKDLANLDAGVLLNWTITFQNGITYSWAPSTGLSSTTGTSVTANPTSSTTYTVTATNYVGCSGTATFALTVNPQPTVTVPTVSPVCTGATIAATSFTSNIAGSTYTWTNSNTAIGLGASGSGNIGSFTATNTGSTALTSTITVTPTSPSPASCPGVPSTYTITVNPKPTVTVPTVSPVCAGATIAATNFTSNVAGTTYTWTNSNTSIGLGASGSGNIASFTATNTGTTALTATITVTPTSPSPASCPGTAATYTITVNPKPTVTVPTVSPVCAGSTIAATNFTSNVAGTTFTWTNSNTAIGLAASGSGDIASFTATNTGTTALTATITVTPTSPSPASCPGTAATYTITVNPKPTVTVPTVSPVCAGATIAATSFTSNIAGTTYAWTNSNTAIGLGASGSGNVPSFTTTNTGTTALTSTITVTPTSASPASCPGTPSTYTITVNPIPNVTVPTVSPVCAGATIAATSFTSNVAGTTYTWTNSNTAIGLAASGSGNIASFTATNTGTTALTATITVTPTSPSPASCPGTAATYTITVNPKPTVTVPTVSPVCAGSTIAATNFTSNVAGTTYTWTNSNTAIGLAASGSGNISSFTATNTGTTALTATITVTPTSPSPASCPGTAATYTITVNPKPTVTVPTVSPVCAGATIAATSFTSNIAGTTYAWTNSNTAIGLGASGSGNVPSFTATNTGTTALTSTITVTPTSASPASCPGTPSTYTITVNPVPNVTVPTVSPVCAGATIAATSFTSNVAGTTYTWTNSNTSIGLGASGSGDIASFTATNTGTTALTATITVTPTSPSPASCAGTPATYTITVNPKPTVTVPTIAPVCANTTVAATNFTSNIAGTTYTWTNSNTAIGLGGSGSGNIGSFTATNSTASAITATITVTPTSASPASCPGTPSTYTITVNPLPVITSVPFTNETSCGASDGTITINATGSGLTYSINGGTSFVAGNTFTGLAGGSYGIVVKNSFGCTVSGGTISISSASAPAAPVALASPNPLCESSTLSLSVSSPVGGQTYNWSGPGGFTAVGPNATINNVTTAMSGTYAVTATVGSCVSPAGTVTVTVNPKPTVTVPTVSPVCANSTVAATNFGSNLPGTTYAWTNSNTAIGLGANGSGNVPSFTATNTGTTVFTSTITVTPTSASPASCPGTPSTYTITVNPLPTVTVPTVSPVCANATIAATNFTSNLAGTTYTWTNSNTAIGLGSSGSGNIASFTATNTGTTALTSTITVTPISASPASCSGTPSTYTITVNPLPTVIVPVVSPVCAGATIATTNFTSNLAGTTYTWTNSNTAIGLGASGSGNIAGFTATNSTTAPITATITVTPTSAAPASCPGTLSTYTITVNPVPTVTVPAVSPVCAGATIAATNFTSNIAGATYTWTNSNTSIGLAASGSGDIGSFTATNTGTTALTATITVTPTSPAPASCSGTPSTYTITVNPLPTVTVPTVAPVCAGATIATTNFTSNLAGTTYTWTNSNTAIGLGASGSGNIAGFTATNSTTAPITATVTVTPVSASPASCTGTPSSYTITVNPSPDVVATPSPQSICSGNATSISLSGGVAGTTYSWTVNSVGASGASAGNGTNIAQTLLVTGGSAGVVTYSVTPSANTCAGTPITVTVNVNPIPFVTATPSPQTICSNTATSISLTSFTAGTTFDWTANNGAGVSGASAGSGSTISQTLINSLTTAGSASYTVTPTAAGCSGLPVTVNVTVNPIPSMNPDAQTICSGQATNISLSSAVSGTSFSWPAPTQTGATGGNAGNASSITDVLSATGSTAGTVVYSVTPTANSCSGTPVLVTITVNPNPTATASPAQSTICSGTTTSIPLTSDVAGTTFTWTAVSSGVSGESNSSGNNISQTLTATGTTSGTVTYNITATTPDGCTSTIPPVVITVDPLPVITATAAPSTICSGETTSINMASTVAGTLFSWTAAETDVTGASAGTGSSITQALTTTLTTPGSATYAITSSANGCAGNTEIVTITVNPVPTVTATPTAQDVCNGTATSISMTSDVAGTTYSWTVSATGVTGAFPGNGNSITQSLSLTGTSAGTVVYTVTPSASGCATATPSSVTITVNPIDDPAFAYSGSTFCQTGSDPTAVITGGSSGIFSASPAGLVFIDSLTGQIDLSASTLGNYAVTFTTNGLCPNNSTTSVNITNAPDAAFSYATPVCQSGMAFPSFGPTSSAGVFSATPSGLNFINTATGQIDLATSTPGTYMITNFIAASGGCAPASDSMSFVVDQAASVNAGSDNTICEGIVYSLTGVMGGSASSVAWTTNGTGTFSDSTSLTPTYTPSAADVANGIVTLTISTNDPAGVCNQATDNLVLMITPADDASFSYSGSTFCQSGTDPAATITGLAGGQFTYSPPGLSINASTGLISLTGSALGTYEVYYTTNGACPRVDSASVTITNAPSATFSFTSGSTGFCQTDVNPVPVFGPGASAGTFTATPAGLVFVNATTWEIDLAASAPGTYTLTNTIVAAGGCASAVDSLMITINPPAIVEAGAVSAAICAGSTYTVSGDSIGGATTSLTWTSSGSGSFSPANALHPVYTPSSADNAAGTVTLYISSDDPAGACGIDVDSLILTINPTPSAPAVTNPAAYCTGSTVAPLVYTGSGGTVNWYSDAALTTNVGTGTSYTPVGVTGTTSFWVTETLGTCASTASQVTISFNPLPVADSTTAVVNNATCGNLTGSITNVTIVSGQSPYTYLWQDALGATVGSSLDLTNVGPGVYTLTITDGNGCATTIGGGSAFNISSTSGVVAAFTADPSTGEKPLLVNFVNSSTGATNYLWQFPNGDTDTTFNAVYTFTELGTQTACLIADNGSGCADTACTTIDVFINSTFVIPNIFTPNGDDINDVFTVKNVGLETMDAEIYNRWGQKEYEWHTTNGGWDGRTAAGVLVPDGTYFFIISAKGYDGKEYFEKGSFELIR